MVELGFRLALSKQAKSRPSRGHLDGSYLYEWGSGSVVVGGEQVEVPRSNDFTLRT